MTIRRLPSTFSLVAIVIFEQVIATAVVCQHPPAEALRRLAADPTIEATLFASEPMIANPSAIDVDTRGRVWVAEIQWYRAAAKQPPADAIKVLEDTNGDGVADKVTTFAEGLFCPMSVCVAGTTVYVATSPDLWVYEDKDGDLKADGPPRKLLTGFNGVNHDHGAHSLVLGPDHKWWMAHGDGGFDVQGTDGSRIAYRWGAMLRGELDGSKLEIVASNFRNPYELCVSSFGDVYCSDNDNDGNQSVRICWIMPGGDYGWFGGPPARVPPGTPFGRHWHFRGHLPGFVPATLVTGFGSPCGICYYEGDAFGPHLRDACWHADAGPREVRLYCHSPEGYGMRGSAKVLLSSQADPYFRPDDVCAAPDGSIYVSDWYDGGVGGHAYNDKHRGRIYRLTPKGQKLDRREKPGPYATIDDAIQGLASPNLATQFLARQRLLAEKGASTPALTKVSKSASDVVRARALWILGRSGGEGMPAIIAALLDSNPRFRELAVRILARHGRRYENEILAVARDPSPVVRREALLALAAIDSPRALNALAQFAQEYDGRDRYLLEAINIAARERKPALYEKVDQAGGWSNERLALMQLLAPEKATEHLIRELSKPDIEIAAGEKYIAAAAGLPSLVAGEALVKLATNRQIPLPLRQSALRAVGENLDGAWTSLANGSAASALRELLLDPDMRSTALSVIRRRRLKSLGADVLALAVSPAAPPTLRAEAITLSAELRPKDILTRLRDLTRDSVDEVRGAALFALVDLHDTRSLKDVLAADGPPSELAKRVVDRLLMTEGGAVTLARQVEQGAPSPKVREFILREASRRPDVNVLLAFERFLPASDRPKRLGEAVSADQILALKGDAARGERIFSQSSAAGCKSCHVVHGVGVAVGPELSQIGKKYERRALLETILDPSKAIAPEFVPQLVERTDGDLLVGLVAAMDDNSMTIKDSKGALHRLTKGEVANVTPQKKSLMPDLVLRDVTAQDAADLLAYLLTLTDALEPVTQYWVVGPFDARDGKGLETPHSPESNLASPDFAARHDALKRGTVAWEPVTSEGTPSPTLDFQKYCRDRKAPAKGVCGYLACVIESDKEQAGRLLIGYEGKARAWLNGAALSLPATRRTQSDPTEPVPISLKAGANVVVVKLESDGAASAIRMAVQSPAGARPRTE